MRAISFFVFIYFSIGATSADSFKERRDKIFSKANNAIKVLDEVNRMVRKDSKQISEMFTLEKVEEDNEVVCVDCYKFSKLAKSINDVLEKQNLDPDENLENEVKNLRTLRTVVEYVDDKLQQKCREENNFLASSEEDVLDFENLTLIFSEPLDAPISTVRFFSPETTKEITWLRGIGEDSDKVVRIDRIPGQDPVVNYFKVKKLKVVVKPTKKESQLPTLGVDNEVGPETFKEKTSGELDMAYDTSWQSDAGADKLELSLGPKTEYKYFKPEEVNLISLNAEAEFFNELKLKSEVEIEATSQKAKLSLSNNEGEDIVRLKADDKGYDVTMPFSVGDKEGLAADGSVNTNQDSVTTLVSSFSLNGKERVRARYSDLDETLELIMPYQSDIYGDLSTHGSVMLTNQGHKTIDSSLSYKDKELFKTTYSEDPIGKSSIQLEANRKVASNGKFSIKLKKELDSDDESAWLSYEQKF